MLLLYLNHVLLFPQFFRNLHSTMLLLYQERQISSFTADEFTFHYASTLSLSTKILFFVIFLIYIPLCFYFIVFLFFIVPTIIFIYIPLCFYFIAIKPYCSHSLRSIYIPLCFYFIHVRRVRRNGLI